MIDKLMSKLKVKYAMHRDHTYKADLEWVELPSIVSHVVNLDSFLDNEDPLYIGCFTPLYNLISRAICIKHQLLMNNLNDTNRVELIVDLNECINTQYVRLANSKIVDIDNTCDNDMISNRLCTILELCIELVCNRLQLDKEHLLEELLNSYTNYLYRYNKEISDEFDVFATRA